jgi:hypothetical protein
MQQKNSLRARLSAKRMALIAIFVALSYVVSFLEIPMPILGAEFLKLDFGNVFIVLISFLLGPVEGLAVCFLKESLRCLTSSSLCAGELANFMITGAYLVLPATVYRYKKSGKRGIMPADKVVHYNRIDIGIFLCFLELCLIKNDIAFERELFTDTAEDECEEVLTAKYKLI